MLFRTLICVFVFFGYAQGAVAQSKKELAAQDAILAQRLSVLENRMLTGDPAAERLMQRMDALESSQRTLTGEVERLRHERDSLQLDIQALAAEIASLQSLADEMRLHLKAVDAVASQNPTERIYGGGRFGGGVYAGGSSIPGPPTIIGETDTFSAVNDVTQLARLGQDKMREGDFAAAQTAFSQYLEFNPEAADRGDVYFWLGETYFVKGGYADAAEAYIASMRLAPKGPYAPEAMVRLAGTARAMGKTQMACQTLASFPSEYPNAGEDVRQKARVESQRSGC